MATMVLESRFVMENGVLTERNMHEDIHKVVAHWNPSAIEYLKTIDEQIALLNKAGFEMVYTLKSDPVRLKQFDEIG